MAVEWEAVCVSSVAHAFYLLIIAYRCRSEILQYNIQLKLQLEVHERRVNYISVAISKHTPFRHH